MTDDELINRMEFARTANNVNWMKLVRLAVRVAPTEARAIFAAIEAKDREIAAIIRLMAVQE